MQRSRTRCFSFEQPERRPAAGPEGVSSQATDTPSTAARSDPGIMRAVPVRGDCACCSWTTHVSGTPRPANRKANSCTPRPAQQSASFPSITTAGTLRIPYCRAFVATSSRRMSRTSTSHEGHATWLMNAIVSSQAGHPALKTSILRFAFTVVLLYVCTRLLSAVLQPGHGAVDARRGQLFQIDATIRTTMPP